MSAPIDPQALFDAEYYAHDCGRPYQRDEVWFAVFNRWAEHLVRDIRPTTVLDAGCAWGFLVETLRERQVQAWGIDVSEYAIGQVHERVRAYCRVGSITEPFERRYDLITCIEVLEHLPQADSERALANLCAHTDDILFSSSPDDHETTSHFNVQPPEYWIAQFAQHGFFHDLDFDASFITPWAMRLRRIPAKQAAAAYARRLTHLQQQNQHLNAQVQQQSNEATRLQALAQAQAVDASSSTNTLILSHDVVGPLMAGPGIRYVNLARTLAAHVPVTLAIPEHSPQGAEEMAAGFRMVRYRVGDWDSIAAYARVARSIVLPGDLAAVFPQLSALDAGLVIDGYNPLLAEWLLTQNSGQQPIGDAAVSAWQTRMMQVTPQALLGDFFICASERQRDWWLGVLEAHGRLNPFTVRDDVGLRKLIDVVPFGLPEVEPTHTRNVIKGVWPGIGPQDKVILWGGGLWPWLDPLTAIRAVAEIWRECPTVRLVFPGTRHPNPHVAGIPTLTQAAQQLASDLNVRDKAVFFDDWVRYPDWANVLMESDVALTLHRDTLEARLAWRTRVLDYIWAGVPSVATQGDATAELIAHYGVGELIAHDDVNALVRALRQLLGQPRHAWAERFASARADLTWTRAAEPLVRYCQRPYRAADRAVATGNPFYAQREGQALQTVVADRDRWRDLAQRYANGKIMRALRWLKR